MILIARLGTLEQQGEFTFVLGLIAPLSMVARMNLRAVLATDHKNEYGLQGYFLNRLLLSALLLLSVPVLIFISSLDAVFIGLFLAVLSYKIIEGLSDLLYGFFQKNEKLGVVSGSLLIRSCLIVFAFIIGLKFFNSVRLSAIFAAILWLISFFAFEARLTKKNLWRFTESDWAEAVRIAIKCWPLGITMSLISLVSYTPIYFLSAYHTMEDVGLFAAINYLWILGSYLSTSMIQALSGNMARIYHSDLKKYIMILALLSAFSVLIGLLGFVVVSAWGDTIMVSIYGPQYGGLTQSLSFILWSVVLSIPLALLGLSLTISRSFYKMMMMNSVVLLFCLMLGWKLVPSGGVEAAAAVVLFTVLFKFCISLMINFYTIRNAYTSRLRSENGG